MTNVIANAAVLVELNISVWGATRLDHAETQKVNADAGAVTNAAQVRKDILAGSKLRKAIADFAAGCRMEHNKRTMPWSDKGPRLLPTSMFLEYKTEFNNRKGEFDTLVDTFVDAYDDLVAGAATDLGTMFDASLYPSKEEVKAKFGFKLVFSPVPDTGHFCVDTTVEGMETALDEMKQSYEGAFQSRLAAVTLEPWERLYEMLDGMSKKMTEEAGPRFRNRKTKDGTIVQQEIKRPYHESFVSNALDMVDMLKHLNITKDPKLEKARLALHDAIFNVDIEAVRESPDTRAEIKAKVDTILEQNKPEFDKAHAELDW